MTVRRCGTTWHFAVSQIISLNYLLTVSREPSPWPRRTSLSQVIFGTMWDTLMPFWGSWSLLLRPTKYRSRLCLKILRPLTILEWLRVRTHLKVQSIGAKKATRSLPISRLLTICPFGTTTVTTFKGHTSTTNNLSHSSLCMLSPFSCTRGCW
jgi:hypothetical protein